MHKNTSAAHAGRSNFIRQAVIVFLYALISERPILWTHIQKYRGCHTCLSCEWCRHPLLSHRKSHKLSLEKAETFKFLHVEPSIIFSSLIYLSFKYQEILCKNNLGKLPLCFSLITAGDSSLGSVWLMNLQGMEGRKRV